MPHTLILGTTMSGKTYLAKRFAAGFRGRGRRVAVLDPIGTTWPATFATHDPARAMAYCRQFTGLIVFVDESGDVLARPEHGLGWLATRGRHFGHSCWFIAQRIVQVPKTMRDQCATLYLFASSASDAQQHADEWNAPQLLAAPELAAGEFFRMGRFGPRCRGKIDFSTGAVKLWTISKMPGGSS
jgi:hypothetical protein